MKKTLYLLALVSFILTATAAAQESESTTQSIDPVNQNSEPEAQTSGPETQNNDPEAQVKQIPELQHKDFQITFFFPPFSTNWVQNSKTVNKVSLNLLAGNAGGVDGVELGGIVNTVNYNVKGFQGAGIGNVVGDSLDGAQLAGIFNVNGGATKNFQGAGIFNVTGSTMQGAQIAGIANVSGSDVSGFQGAGIVNVAGRDTRGCQAAGIASVSGRHTQGAQISGMINVATSYTRGAQLSGFVNVAGTGVVNTQLAGYVNYAGEIDGAQLAGFVNVSNKVRGLQLGFLNFCDSIDGVPIGFVSVVKKNGYRHVDFTISETQYFNVSYKMGVRHFYNIYSLGKPSGPGNRWLFGFGLGGEFDLREDWSLNVEGIVNQEFWIAEKSSNSLFLIDRLNLLNQVRALFAFSPNDKIQLFFGPSLNVAVAETNPDIGYLPWYEIGPNWDFYQKTSGNVARTNVKIWFGITGGVRL